MFSIEELIAQWEVFGVFDWLLPFLLIFAVVFGILTSTGILGGNRGTSMIVALVIGLISLRVGFVQAFFAELFPRFAVGLAVLMVVVILGGLFFTGDSAKGWFIGLSVGGVVIGLVAVIFTFDEFNWFGSFFWQDNIGIIIVGILLLILIIAMFVTAGKKPPAKELKLPLEPFRKMMGG